MASASRRGELALADAVLRASPAPRRPLAGCLPRALPCFAATAARHIFRHLANWAPTRHLER
eukprot:4611139-Lingulodinium_polyedra.AAC.1